MPLQMFQVAQLELEPSKVGSAHLGIYSKVQMFSLSELAGT